MGDNIKRTTNGKKRAKSGIAVSTSDLEPDTGNELLATKATPRLNPPVNIHFHSMRHRLCDIDGLSGKAVIDQFVKSKVLPNDSPQYVKSVTFSQEKIPSNEEEKTIVTITETT